MLQVFLTAALIALMMPAAQADECEGAQDQATMTACAQQTYEASDGEMNRLYREIEQRLGDDARHLLAETERAWQAFRDAECTFSASAVTGGSVFPMVRALCLDDLTQRRVEDLQQYLSCAEGDLSCAVPPASEASSNGTCAGVDIDLTATPKQEYAQLIADAISEDLDSSEALRPGDVEVYRFLESGSWSAVYGAIPTADIAMFFFEEVDDAKQFRDVWGGWADPSERSELIEWAEKLGAPESLASCFAHYIVDDTIFDDTIFDDTGAKRPFGFTIDLAFSAEALDTLGRRDEKVVVSASYYADPAPDGEEMADDVGRITLGSENVQVAAEPGVIEITGAQVDVDALQWTQGDIMVDVSIYTARLSGPDNLVSCDIIQGRLSDVTVTPPIELHCALIEEDMEIEVNP